MRQQVADKAHVIGAMRILGNQDLVVGAVPTPRPILVRPAQAVREVRLARSAYLLDGAFEQSLAGKPIVVIAKAVQRVLARKRGLLLADLRHAQVIEPRVRRQLRLVVPDEIWRRASYVSPLRETLAPP